MKKLLLFCTLLALAGCAEFDEPMSVQESETIEISHKTRAGETPVFETMANPYALTLMRELIGNPSLQPTHIYGRFLPQDSTQLYRLENTLDLDLFDYPLDINIEEGEVYVDPSIPAGEYPWQYTVVPANFVFPTGITWEKLYDCYIPADNEEVPPSSTRAPGGMNLEMAAILECGYSIQPTTRASGKPSGRVTVRDDVRSRYEPVKGVRVKCHYFIKSGRAFTDENGNYSIDRKFYVQPKYTVVFRNIKDFVVWDWPGHRAKYKVGRHNQSGYNINIETDTEGWAWAAINNAAYDYYRMCEATGIANPPKQLKIYDANGATGGQSSAPMISRFPALRLFTHTNWVTFVFWGNIGSPSPIEAIFGIDSLLWLFMPDLIIYTQDSDYGDIFNTVSHELAHASHFSKVGGDYWANYVDHIVDKSGYGDTRSGNNAGYCEVGEMWGHAMGDILHSEQFDENRLSQPYFVHNMNFRGTTFWIHPDPIWALITRGVLTKKQVFDSMTSDVDTVEKWINKLCSGKATETANAIRTAFAHDDVPVIQGTNPSSINANATYTVPAEENMPDNFTFNGWTVTPDSGYTITGGTTSRDLTIKFTSSGTYTLTANFQLPDGTDYAATKSFTLKPPPPPTPIIAASHEYIPKGSVVTFNVTNAGNPEYSYVWEIDGELVFTPGGGPSLSIIAGASNNPVLFGLQDPKLPIDPEDPPGGPTIYKIIYARCRAQHGGVYSQWSSTISVAVTNN